MVQNVLLALLLAVLIRPSRAQKHPLHHGAHGGGGGGGSGGGGGFVRPVDEGLVYASIHAYKDEWNRTFRPYENIHGVANLDTPSPFHFFFRCVDGVARMYFTIEDLHSRPINNQPQGSEVKMPLVLFKERVKLHIDRVPTEYNLVRVAVRAVLISAVPSPHLVPPALPSRLCDLPTAVARWGRRSGTHHIAPIKAL